ncbi:MAG TPA: hypothetical protein VIG33_10680 [Pseudobdellovibrionaceae bacterium]|jgi:hypothetical protein
MNTEEQENKNKDVIEKDGLMKKEFRLVISQEAEAAVTDITNAVNDGFEAGRATRFDVANSMLLWFKAHAPEDVIFELRRKFADAVTMLEAIQKKAKSSGELPPEIKAALEKYYFGVTTSGIKKAKNNLKQECITDIHKDSEVA